MEIRPNYSAGQKPKADRGCYGAGLKTHGPPEQASKATEDEKARGYTHTELSNIQPTANK